MKAKLELGAELDLLSPAEFHTGLDRVEKFVYAWIDGLRHMRFPVLQATVPASGDLTLGSTSDADSRYVGPGQGYVWQVHRISVFGLSSPGGTPETLQVYFGDPGPSRYVGTLSASGTEWDTGKGLLLKPGDHLVFVGTGLTVGEQVTINGEAVQAPAEQAGKLLGG